MKIYNIGFQYSSPARARSSTTCTKNTQSSKKSLFSILVYNMNPGNMILGKTVPARPFATVRCMWDRGVSVEYLLV